MEPNSYRAAAALFIFMIINNCITLYSSQHIGQQRGDWRSHNATRAPYLLQRGDQPPPPDIDFDYGPHHPFSDSATYRPVYRRPGHRAHPCEKGSCYPQTGNLLIGRESQLYASSTCGMNEAERYCIVAHLEDKKKCFWCDSRPTDYPKPDMNHNISNIVYRVYPGTNKKTWWQSENGKENVYIQLDLEAEFHFTHIIITFKTFRPAAMLIERSYDFKKSWQVYRYFAHNCDESFPGVSKEQPHNLADVVCESKYSNVEPSSDGELIYRVLLPHVRIDNPYSSEVQNLMKMTNLRINFTKLHTLGDDHLDRREEIQEKYYYSITDMVVRGSCSCYGHANRCLPLPGQSSSVIDMVHGRCECTHNTKGRNCEKCEDFFNDLPWGPAVGLQANACKRCNCNNHATSCHFDPAVYEQSGKTSGGVCDGCKHNTMGYNCEQCKEFYYVDPNRDIQDPDVCRPCDCDPHGTTDDGNCDPIGDPTNNIEAGSCHCKANVEGRRCDSCKNGFWNFTDENPEGCESCSCNRLGTVDNQGCNVYTGECTCKRYVVGRDCNQCMQEFWGLSEKQDGCQPCDCDPGGSYDNFCDVIDGQCKCRPDMTGRNCSTPKQQHFSASLDFLLYEAEAAKSSPNCQVVIREPYREPWRNTWTGPGTVKTSENSYIEFYIDNIHRSMNYDPVVRYIPNGETWEEVKMTIIREEPIDPNGPCKDESPEGDIKYFMLPGHETSAKVEPPVCLEEGKTYKIRLDFGKANSGRDSSKAVVQIDAIVLVPNFESIPWFYGSAPAENRRRDFEAHNCGYFNYSGGPREISEACKEHYNSIGVYIYDGSPPCQCDPTGSVSKLCDEYGGQCECKPNVVGRRCDRCAPGTFGFGPEGCMACDCNNIGSLDNFCNATTGQCGCRPHTYGRQCNQCRTGFWNFPNCQRCDCNGHADICDSLTGTCTDCRDNTEGPSCDRCDDGFYGDPRLNVDIACRPCPCPGIPGSGHSYADRCSMDAYTKDVICECKEGYAGARCDVCADNYFGNPEEVGGSCKPCDCSNKVNPLMPGNCDAKTGQCKQCLYNTTGDHCEMCKPGFHRGYDGDTCIECYCDILGTNSSSGHCNPDNGQCPCFPNVIGKNCDTCAENHWKIASGVGCEPCGCDDVGSDDSQCHPYEGQCVCKPNYGGRQCNECKAEYWGNPKLNECHKCDCDPYGTLNFQCNRKTGACVCRPGIGGHRCDKCARGYIGDAPHCQPCGECFDNWDRILHEYENNTLIEIERASTIKKEGARGAYTKEFDEMQSKLNEVETLLQSTEVIDLDSIDATSETLQKRVKDINEGPLKQLSDNLASVDSTNKQGERKLDDLEKDLQRLANKTKELQENATLLREANVQGALTLIEQAKEKANRAVQNADMSAQRNIDYASRQCKAIEHLIKTTKDDVDSNHEAQEAELKKIRENVKNLTSVMPELNDLVCDRRGDPCDSICGGAGCGVCGVAVSCEHGAKQLAEMALQFANETEEILRQKEQKANEFIRNVNTVNTPIAKQNADAAYNAALDAWTKANETFSRLAFTKKELQDFLNSNITKPEDIEERIQEVLDKKLTSDRDEIRALAEKIKKASETQENIEGIIADTEDDLLRAQQLKDSADSVKHRVEEIRNLTAIVNEKLANSSSAQKAADDDIRTASESVSKVEGLLNDVEAEYSQAKQDINHTDSDIKKLQKDISELQLNASIHEHTASTFMATSQNIDAEAKRTREELDTLHKRYNETANRLNESMLKVKYSEDKATNLVDRAVNLTSSINKISEELNKMTNQNPDITLGQLEMEIDRLNREMEEYNAKIQKKLEDYKICT